MPRVKVCGCRSVDIAMAAAEAGADFIGLMFAPSSRRRVELDDASDIVRALGSPLAAREMRMPPAVFRTAEQDLTAWFEHGSQALDRLLERKRPLTVGVFAGNDPDEINEIADEVGVDLIQLSGGEPWGNCLLANRQVIKALHIHREDNAETAMMRMEVGSAMAVLLDHAAPNAFGGTGQPLDWALAADVAAAMPVWLAGGLNPDNVAKAIQLVRPWAVDVSSGVETDGAKDASKIRAFVAAAKGALE